MYLDRRSPVIQIAGVRDAAEADLLIAAGVDWLGFPLRLPVNVEDTDEATAARIVAHVGDRARCILITYLADVDAILGFCGDLGVTAVQLHGPVPVPVLASLRCRSPGLGVIKSLVVQAANAARLRRETVEAAPYVDAFITDTFDPATGASGATGKTHDWTVSRALVRLSPKPVILAGGLVPANLAEAIRRVRPAGVDAHTGVEGPDGRKDPDLLARFVADARAAFAMWPPYCEA